MQKVLCLLCFLLWVTCLDGHEGHQHPEKKETQHESVMPSLGQPSVESNGSGSSRLNWMQWMGSLHLILLHFPIALITMTAVAELLFVCKPKPIFDYTPQFMLIAAAVLSFPTALLGLVYSFTAPYEGWLEHLLWWHGGLGIATALLVIVVVLVRECLGKNKFYYISLIFLFLLVNITAYIGGGITFGSSLYPSLNNRHDVLRTYEIDG